MCVCACGGYEWVIEAEMLTVIMKDKWSKYDREEGILRKEGPGIKCGSVLKKQKIAC